MGNILSPDAAQNHKLLGNANNDMLMRYFDSVGNSTGTKNMATTVDEYFLTPGVNDIYLIDSIRFAITDSSALDADGFGGIAALSNGCLLKLQEFNDVASDILDILDGVPIKSHGELSAIGDIMVSDTTIPGCFIRIDMHFSAPLRLDGSKYHRLMFKVQDDLSALVSVYVYTCGRVFTTA